MKILTNHIGYETNGPKKAIIQTEKPLEFDNLEIVENGTRDIVFQCKKTDSGIVPNWKNRYFNQFDFSEFNCSGIFFLVLKTDNSSVQSEPFEIRQNIFENQTLDPILSYFYSQRCSEQYDQADRNLPFYGTPEKEKVDVHGGWYDASGDVSKYLSHLSYANYMNPQQTPMVVWCMLEAYSHITNLTDNTKKRLIKEALWGADFLIRMQDADGYFYMTIFDTWSKQPEQREICSYKTQKGDKFNTWQAGFRQGGGMTIAALARMHRLNLNGEYTAEQYLLAAKIGYQHLKKNNLEYLDDHNENIIDDYCALMAATELYKATKEDLYYVDAEVKAESLINRISSNDKYQGWFRADENGVRPFYHASDAGLPITALVCYLSILKSEKEIKRVTDKLIEVIQHQLKLNQEVYNPFGYPRQYVKNLIGDKYTSFFIPHENETGYWWQGENARIASLSASFSKAKPYILNRPELTKAMNEFIQDQFNWILGLNPYDVCMLDGKGRNNPNYMDEKLNAPGGICNGITSGFEDESDIDFVPKGPGQDPFHSWRWGEQWIPHAAWFLASLCRY